MEAKEIVERAISEAITAGGGRGKDAVVKQLKAVSNALYTLARNYDSMEEHAWVDNMALLSGMATGVMLTAAEFIEGRE